MSVSVSSILGGGYVAENDRNRAILPEPKTEAARQARKKFDRGVEKQLEKEKEIAFNILVWGMSLDSNIPIARKRIDIRNQLIEDGHSAMFSESLANLGSDLALSEASRELAQAREADFIIVLVEGSPGALAEICDFCVRPDIAHKVYIMAPQSYRAGYPGRGDLRDLDEGYGVVHWYEREDVSVCNLLTQACDRVRARRSIAYRHQPGRAD